MDDKKYFCFDGDNMPDSIRYYTNGKAKCSGNGKDKQGKVLKHTNYNEKHITQIFLTKKSLFHTEYCVFYPIILVSMCFKFFYVVRMHLCVLEIISQDKYPKKLLKCIAISNRGISKPYFAYLNTDICINECLDPKLLPFKHTLQSDFNYLFWPD